MTEMLRERWLGVVACLLSVLLLLAYAFARQQLPPWWAANGGGIFYVLFWILLWYVMIPAPRYFLPICIGCVLFTCGLEFAQLWNPEPLAAVRRTRWGAAWLGSTFVWSDFPPYFIGGMLGYIVLRILHGLRSTPLADSMTEDA